MMGRKKTKAQAEDADQNDSADDASLYIIELVRQGDEYVDAQVLSEQERFVADGFWPKVVRYIAQIPFTGDLTAAYYAATDPETPAFVRAWLLAALGYFIIPTDAMPDFLFGIGFTDDAAVLATTMQMIFTHITPEHRQRAAAALAEVRAGERQDPFQEPPK